MLPGPPKDEYLNAETTCSVASLSFQFVRKPSKGRPLREVLPDWIKAAEVYLALLQGLGKSRDGTTLIIRENASPYSRALRRLEQSSREIIKAAVAEKLLRYEAQSVRGVKNKLSELVEDALSMVFRHFVARNVPGFEPNDWVTTEFAGRLGKWLKIIMEWATTLGVPVVVRLRTNDPERPALDRKDLLILAALKRGDRLMSEEDISRQTRYSRTTIRTHQNRLIKDGLVHRPNGQKGGAGLTSKGRNIVS